MGTSLFIVYAPGLNFAPGIFQRHEPVFIQAFHPKPAVARLHRRIVRWVPGHEKSIRIPHSYTHLSSIFPANSEPLSVFSNGGKGRLNAKLLSTAASSVECKFWPTQIPQIFMRVEINDRQQA